MNSYLYRITPKPNQSGKSGAVPAMSSVEALDCVHGQMFRWILERRLAAHAGAVPAVALGMLAVRTRVGLLPLHTTMNGVQIFASEICAPVRVNVVVIGELNLQPSIFKGLTS